MAVKNDSEHNLEIVDNVPDRFICQICTGVFHDPHLVVCCGQHFCKSCLSKWFEKQGKISCPHCRAEGKAFHCVVHKGLRSEINQITVKCINHSEGCEWTGELGEISHHLESDEGCGYVTVSCPNKCQIIKPTSHDKLWLQFMMKNKATYCTMKRKDLDEHLTNECYLRPYQCKYCDRKDTYEAIMGGDSLYGGDGHQAKCPEAPLPCPNECGSQNIKRKDIKNHRSQCPQESVKCPFAEAGCEDKLVRCQFDGHMVCNQQQHLLLVMQDCHETKKKLSEANKELSKTNRELSMIKEELSETKKELSETKKGVSLAKGWLSQLEKEQLEVKGTLTTAVQLLSQGNETDKETIGFVITCSSSLRDIGDQVKVVMPKFSKYRCSGKVWHSPPFYYREAYKMCLAVYANGVGEGAGTHVSVAVLLLGTLRGVHEYLPERTGCMYAPSSI